MTQLSLIGLLITELVYLTVRFDSEVLDRASSPWLRVVAWSPQYLRLAIAVAVMGLVLNTWRRVGKVSPSDGPRRSMRLTWLAVHLAAFALFIQTSNIVFEPARAAQHPAAWVLAWFGFGILTLAAWAIASWPRRIAWLASSGGRAFAGVAAALGGAAWVSAHVSEALWAPLARATFRVVGAMLGLMYPRVIAEPEHLTLGTPVFAVTIAPECSGYEGIGLLLAFLGVYFWVFRRELRFPLTFVLLPIGAATVWIANALRIAALIAIGTAGWRSIALGGFHSQAGWIAFNAIALGFVVALNRSGWLRKDAGTATTEPAHRNDAAPYLGPFLAVVACAMVTGAFSAGIDWLYPLRVVAAAGVLWMFRHRYGGLGWTCSWYALAIGVATFVIWVALVPTGPSGGPLPAALRSVPFAWAVAWLIVRTVGYTVATPLVEELAFRAYLTRRLMRVDFDRLPIGRFSWWSFLASSLLFGALHGRQWLPGTIAGMLFALAMYRQRAIGDAVIAHAMTNGLIAAYVLATGRWSMWG